MQAFHNSPEIKYKFLTRVRQHQEADEIIQDVYWENGKGCAVGCTLEMSNEEWGKPIHQQYEIELGIPIILSRLEDGIFEGLPVEKSKLWPYKFLNAINVGADLSDVWPKFAIWLLMDDKYGVVNFAKNDQSRLAIQKIADYYGDFKNITIDEWSDAYAAAAYAGGAYAGGAAYAAHAAAYAAAAAADAAAAAPADAATYKNKKHEIRIAQADKLLELLKNS